MNYEKRTTAAHLQRRFQCPLTNRHSLSEVHSLLIQPGIFLFGKKDLADMLFVCCLKVCFELLGFHSLGKQDITTQQTFRLLLVAFNDASKSILKETFVVFSLSFWCLCLHFCWNSLYGAGRVKKSFHFFSVFPY